MPLPGARPRVTMGSESELQAGLQRRASHQVKSPALGVGDKPQFQGGPNLSGPWRLQSSVISRDILSTFGSEKEEPMTEE